MQLLLVKQHEEYSIVSSINMMELFNPPIPLEASPPPSLWDLLPDDIAVMIFANLHTGDRVRMMLVCKSWQQTLLREDIPVAAAESPWRILSEDSYSKPEYHMTTAMRFNSLSENRIYRFDLPAGGGLWCCCGSSNGWLLMARTRERELWSAEIMLWNPITESTRKLPALSTLSFYARFVERAEAENVSNFIKEVIVCEFDPTNIVVAVIFSHPAWGRLERYLALCTPQDQRWTFMFPEVLRTYRYMGLCYHKRKLCVLVDVSHRLYPDRRDATTLHPTGCAVEMQVIWYNHREYTRRIPRADNDEELGISIYDRVEVQHRLVGLSSGDLAIVTAILDACEYDRLVRIQTGKFEVRVMSNNSFIKLCSIGNEAIFVGCSSSFSVEASSHGVDGECIYFATQDGKEKLKDAEDCRYEIGEDCRYRIREEGVFNLRNNKMQQTVSYTDLRFYSGSCVGWFKPKLFNR